MYHSLCYLIISFVVFPNFAYGQIDKSIELSKNGLLQHGNQHLVEGNLGKYLETSFTLGNKYLNEDNLDSTILVLEKAVSFEYPIATSDTLLASCYHTLGIAYFFKTNDLQAILNWNKAIDLRKNLYPDNHILIIKGLRNIGSSFAELENYPKAEFYLSKADSLNNSSEFFDPIKEAQLSSELGVVNFRLQEYDKAFKYLTVAEELYWKYFSDEPWELDLLFQRWTMYYMELEDGEKMKSYVQKSIDLISTIDNKYDSEYIELAKHHNNLGIAFDLEKNYENAIGSYKRAISLYEEYPDFDGVLKEIATSCANVSTAFMNLDEFQEALIYINKALKIDRALGEKIDLVKDLENKADILLQSKELETALLEINRSLDIISSEKSQNIYLIDKPNRVLVQRTKSKILKALFLDNGDLAYLEQAAALVQENIRLIDQIRSEFISEAAKVFLSKDAKIIIEEGINTYVELYEQTDNPEMILKAWELSEKSKSIILLESLRSVQAKKKNKVEIDLVNTENGLRQEIADVERRIYNNPDSASVFNKEYLNLNKQLQTVSDRIAKENPKYYTATKEFLDISLTQSLKEYDNDVIEYFLGEKASFVFVKSNQQLACYRIDTSQVLQALVSRTRKATVDIFSYNANKDASYEKAVSEYCSAAHSLYKVLFHRIEETLSEDLLIIPDGVLGYLPFDLLLTEESGGINFSTKPYLLNKHNISYTYSIALLEEMSNINATAATKELLAMAPLFENNDEVYRYGNREVKKEKQPPLYFNEPEVEAIQEIMGGEIIVGTQATEEYFMQNAPDYNILHLSTHGKANDEKGSFSYLAFTEIVDSTENEFVYNYDLYNLDLNADMVVLSACETGLGELKQGEGIISLARGFSYAGAKSIINTLWTINDYRTKEIMESFYTCISDGQPKDVALRKAKLDFIQNNPDEALPFYWAAFIPVGDMSPISNAAFSSNPLVFCGLGVLVLLFLGFLWKRNKKALTK